jgi:hypothetical protein
MSKRTMVLTTAAFFAVVAVATAATMLRATPFVFDPLRTELVQSGWLSGIGCPTNARQAIYEPPAYTRIVAAPNYTDPACPTGDPRDRHNEGLLLAKTGPTVNAASAGVVLTGFGRGPITELGYDIRKPMATTDPRGSHCGAGAPRFNITTSDGTTYFIGCNSPPPTTQTPGLGWLRLRWGSSAGLFAYSPSGVLTDISGLEVKRLSIVFDEGQDAGPDNFGLAVLDNIDVNGALVGQGPGPKTTDDNGDSNNGGNDNGGNNDGGNNGDGS